MSIGAALGRLTRHGLIICGLAAGTLLGLVSTQARANPPAVWDYYGSGITLKAVYGAYTDPAGDVFHQFEQDFTFNNLSFVLAGTGPAYGLGRGDVSLTNAPVSEED